MDKVETRPEKPKPGGKPSLAERYRLTADAMTDRNKAGVQHGAFFTKARISSKELAGVMVETWNRLETRFGPEKANLALWLMGRSADFVRLPGGRAAMRERLHELEEAHDLHGRTATAESIDLLKAILKTRRGRRVEG